MKNKIKLTLDKDAVCIRARGLVDDVQDSVRFQTVCSAAQPGIVMGFLIRYLLTDGLEIRWMCSGLLV